MENAWMTSTKERYCTISTRTSGHNPVDELKSNGTRNSSLRFHSCLKTRNVSMTFSRVALWSVRGKRSPSCKTWGSQSNGENPANCSEECVMMPISVGPSFMLCKTPREVGKIWHHHLCNLIERETVQCALLTVVYLFLFFIEVTSHGQTMYFSMR